MTFLPNLNAIKIGLNIALNNEPYQILKANFLRMQQRKPVMQTKLRNLITGKVMEKTFKPGDKVEEADLARSKANFLYQDHQGVHFMDNQNYEQYSFTESQVGDKIKYLKEGQEVEVLKFNNAPVNIAIPVKLDLRVISTAPGVRGDTAQGSVTKPAVVETNATVNVPLFIKEGDTIRVNTETGEYVERV